MLFQMKTNQILFSYFIIKQVYLIKIKDFRGEKIRTIPFDNI